jgi:hypothetical protein
MLLLQLLIVLLMNLFSRGIPNIRSNPSSYWISRIVRGVNSRMSLLLMSVLDLHITQIVILEEIVVVRVLDCAIPIAGCISSRGVIVSLVCFMVQLLHYVLLLKAVIRELCGNCLLSVNWNLALWRIHLSW